MSLLPTKIMENICRDRKIFVETENYLNLDSLNHCLFNCFRSGSGDFLCSGGWNFTFTGFFHDLNFAECIENIQRN
jgi:hypothetical protein